MDLMPFARNARGVQGLRASRRARLDCPARDNRMPMQVPAGAEGASAAEGRAASGRCGRRPQHRCERADARDLERAAREHRMRSRCAAGAEGASAAEGRVAPPPPPSTSLRKTFGYLVLLSGVFRPLYHGLLPILIGKPLAIIARVNVNLDTFFVQSTTNRIRRSTIGDRALGV